MMNDDSEYAIVIVRLEDDDGGGFLGFVPDLPGCMSDGETREEALTNTQEALHEWLSEQAERGVEIPVPGSSMDEAQQRENKLLDAMRSLIDYRETADEKIAELERQLAELIAILRDDSGNLPRKYTFPKLDKVRSKLPH